MGRPGSSDPLGRLHGLSPHHRDTREIRVAGAHTPTVIDGYREIVDHPSRERDGPGQDGRNRGADRGLEVDAPMPGKSGAGSEGLNDGPGDG